MEMVIISSLLALDLYSIYLNIVCCAQNQIFTTALIMMVLLDVSLLMIKIKRFTIIRLCANIAIHIFGCLYPLLRSVIILTMMRIPLSNLFLLTAFSTSSALTLSGLRKRAVYLNVLRYATIVAMATVLTVNDMFIWYLASSIATIGVVMMDLIYYAMYTDYTHKATVFVIGGAGCKDSIVLSHVYATSIALICYVVKQVVHVLG